MVRACLLPVSLLLVVFASRDAAAEDSVAIRGAYYREASTRVIQPVVELRHDAPGGVDVGAYYLLDAITSASVAAGVATDAIFSEYRSEAGFSAGKSWSRTRLGLAYRYSAESDYWSHTLSLNATQRFWGDSASAGVSIGRGFDSVSSNARPLPCLAKDSNGAPIGRSCPIDLWFASGSYSQVLSPTLLAQAAYEVTYLDGFLANPYRVVPNHTSEAVPGKRFRHAVTARLADYWPRRRTGFQLQYRYYFDHYPGEAPNYDGDPWSIHGHMVEGRIFKTLGRDFELRASYRYYRQTAANFWCDVIANPACYGPTEPYYATDPKLAPIDTQLPEIKLWWAATALHRLPFFGWFAAGTFEISYGYYIQSSSFGNAHLLQAGYSMPY